MANSKPRPARGDPLRDARRLTARDRQILAWLAEHYVLSTEQIARALFTSHRYAQRRLALLHRIGATCRFAFARTPESGPGAGSYRHTLGSLGVLLYPTPYTDPDNPAARPPKTLLERRARIMRSPRLDHLLGVNSFFTDLHAATRRRPGRRLARWWSEQHATNVFAAYPGARIRPDGHGVWTTGGATVGFFLEHDQGTEHLARVLGKLAGYERLAVDGPRYPVLFRLPGPRRETHLLQALAGARLPMPVATSVHHTDPAGRVWALPDAPGGRAALHELPSDHGPDIALNPARFGGDPDDAAPPCDGQR
ncbi:MAG: replication-relaxation family protein [Micromonosporaceae bacterium]